MFNSKEKVLLILMESATFKYKNFFVTSALVENSFNKTPGISSSKEIVLVKIEGDNMEPTIFPGDVIICQKAQKYVFVPKGSAAVIITKEGIMVKRLYKHRLKNYFVIVDDNNELKDWEEIQKSSILHLLIIYGKLSHGFPSYQTEEGLTAIEKTLNSISKEVYNIRKKIEKS